MKTITLLFLLIITNLLHAQKKCTVYQYGVDTDTTIGLIIEYDSLDNILKKTYTGFKENIYTTFSDKSSTYHYTNNNLDSIVTINEGPFSSRKVEYYRNSRITNIDCRSINNMAIDSSFSKYIYNEKGQLIIKLDMQYEKEYEEYYKLNPICGLKEINYTYSDSLLIKEEEFVTGGFKEDPIIKKVVTKEYSYNGLICTIKETNHEADFFSSYRVRVTTIQYLDSSLKQIKHIKEVNKADELVYEQEYIYDNNNRLIKTIRTNLFNRKFWSDYIYTEAN